VVVVPVRVNVNLKTITVEELSERRKVRHKLYFWRFLSLLIHIFPSMQILHLSMLKNLRCLVHGNEYLIKARILTGFRLYREELAYDAEERIESLKSGESRSDSKLWGKKAMDRETIEPIKSSGSNSDSKGWDKEIIELVKQEFEALSSTHKRKKASEFNDDQKYKSITTEAIEFKSLALKKLNLFVQLYSENDHSPTILKEVIKRPIIEFAKESVIIEFKTGICGFPWAQLAERSVSVDFGEWTPEGLDPSKIERAVAGLTANQELRTVTIGINTDCLLLNDGWSTAELCWDGSAVVQTSVGVAAFLLRCFSRLSNLSLRYRP
jgi:hypothetical protein